MEFVKSFNIDYGRVLHYWSVNTWSWRIYVVVIVFALVTTLGAVASWMKQFPADNRVRVTPTEMVAPLLKKAFSINRRKPA